MAQVARQVLAVADQKERQVERDEEVEHEHEGVLADGQGVRGDELAALRQGHCHTLLQGGEVDQPEAVQQRGDPTRQGVEHTTKVDRRVHLARLHSLIDACGFARQRGGDQRQGQHHQHQHRQQGGERSKRAPLPASRQQAAVKRREQQRNHRAPQDGAVEGPQDPGHRDRHRRHQQRQRPPAGRFDWVFRRRGHGAAPGWVRRQRPRRVRYGRR